MNHQEIFIYLQALKDAFCHGEYSKEDCELLSYLYVQGGFYMNIIKHDVLFDVTAKTNLVDFAKWVRRNLEAPNIDSSVDISFDLKRSIPYALQSRFDADKRDATSLAFKKYLAYFLAGLQADIMALSVEATDSAPHNKEDAHYVIGMLEITAQNIAAVLSSQSGHSALKYTELEKFLNDSCYFIARVKEETTAQGANK